MITIRQYHEQDRQLIESCLVDFQDYERALQPDRLPGLEVASSYLDYLLEECRTNDGRILVAELDGEIVGYTAIWIEKDFGNGCLTIPTHVRLSDIYVSPQCRGKGIGKLLLKEVEDYGREKGHTRILLNVLSNNQDTIALYRKTGYIDYETIMVKTIV